MPSLDKIILSVHVKFNEVIPNPTYTYFAELERLKIDVVSVSRLGGLSVPCRDTVILLFIR